jgi:hypothetical protein
MQNADWEKPPASSVGQRDGRLLVVQMAKLMSETAELAGNGRALRSDYALSG